MAPLPSPCSLPTSIRRVGLVSTFPPKLCGLATFADALGGALVAAGVEVATVAVDDGSGAPVADLVLLHGDVAGLHDATAFLSDCDAVIVQHEYGIFGGQDGDEVVDLIRTLSVPAIVVLHTVPSLPTVRQSAVLEAVCDLAARVVVMSRSAQDRLLSGYLVDAARVVLIPHGATPPVGTADRTFDVAGSGAELLTWGLLGPGKGIEHMISAMALLGDLRPKCHYTVSGVTHPNVFARSGHRYRDSLIRRAWSNGVSPWVRFDESYRTVPTLMRRVAAATIVVLPYDSRDQVTSGVLVDAIAAGRPVVATAFPHAVELLSDGAGIVVPHGNPVALASAVRVLLIDQELLARMSARSAELGTELTWTSIAARYRQLCGEVLGVPLVLQ